MKQLALYGFKIGSIGANETTFIEAVKKFLDAARKGSISQSDYNYYSQFIDVDASLASTQEYMDKVALTLEKTTVYRAVDNQGLLSDAYIFTKENQELGKIYGSVKSKAYNKTFFVLDSILQGKIRFVPVVETRLKKSTSSNSSSGGSTATNTNSQVGKDVYAPTEDKKTKPSSYSSGNTNYMLYAGGALLLASLFMGKGKGKGLMGLLGLSSAAPKKRKHSNNAVKIDLPNGQFIRVKMEKSR